MKKSELRQAIFDEIQEHLDYEEIDDYEVADLAEDIITLVENEHPDVQRLDFLQEVTDEERFTGEVLLRDSTTGRGWRLHEARDPNATRDVRKAIDRYRDPYDEDRPEAHLIKQERQPHDIKPGDHLKIAGHLAKVEQVEVHGANILIHTDVAAVTQVFMSRGSSIEIYRERNQEDQ